MNLDEYPHLRAIREARTIADQMPEGPRIDLAAAARAGVHPDPAAAGPASSPKAAFAAGAASMLGIVALVRRRR